MTWILLRPALLIETLNDLKLSENCKLSTPRDGVRNFDWLGMQDVNGMDFAR
jgi:hypothetical protein